MVVLVVVVMVRVVVVVVVKVEVVVVVKVEVVAVGATVGQPDARQQQKRRVLIHD
jgi:hypothetical protein